MKTKDMYKELGDAISFNQLIHAYNEVSEAGWQNVYFISGWGEQIAVVGEKLEVEDEP